MNKLNSDFFAGAALYEKLKAQTEEVTFKTPKLLLSIRSSFLVASSFHSNPLATSVLLWKAKVVGV
jgi:hypothetical protein